jgi:hypothetical protein
MFFIFYGWRTIRIKKYKNTGDYCRECKSFDIDIKVYRKYFHIAFIPFFPSGKKTVDIKCNSCGNPFRLQPIQENYGAKTRTPFYFYTGVILIALLVLFIIKLNLETQDQKKLFVNSPKPGDIYLIRDEAAEKVSYYFLKVVEIDDSSIKVNHNRYVYDRYVSNLQGDDSFEEEKLFFTRKEIIKMLEDGKINSVDRIEEAKDLNNGK